ncbi:UNVERIFIED_CONTAM: hypothetical protein Slati_3494200 [Sesamum latifolium]|uniref:Reverse transcriptase domain-containing protein n=1 Tax=Sesamum latifolium TaxID=2727402 RepID=A0AAW2UHL0_9LAMI
MAPLKSLGPDGMPPFFFQTYWHIVRHDVESCTLSLLNDLIMPPGLNHTHIALIPKCKKSKTLTQFCPISLCNVAYKIASKTIANRLKPLLDTIISPCQAAFVSDRLITDNVLLTFEVNHYLKTKRWGEKGHMALKLDISKAYDKSIRDRVWNRISGWNERYLSQAGKEILIKAVAQAIPTYTTGCFRLPFSLIKELQSMVAYFWWHNAEARKIHWLSWKKLCTQKAQGGMEFRDLQAFNLAILSKQLWRLVSFPSTLLSQAVLDVVRGGFRWRIGSGCSVQEWDRALVRTLFWHEEVEAILAIPLSSVDGEDFFVWNHIANSIFSVRSANHVAVSLTNESLPSASSSSLSPWKILWKVNVPGKIRVFIWKLAKNALPIGVNLQQKL